MMCLKCQPGVIALVYSHSGFGVRVQVCLLYCQQQWSQLRVQQATRLGVAWEAAVGTHGGCGASCGSCCWHRLLLGLHRQLG